MNLTVMVWISAVLLIAAQAARYADVVIRHRRCAKHGHQWAPDTEGFHCLVCRRRFAVGDEL